MPAVSVLISTYNEPQWLEWVLLGYARQTCTDFEMIVVDDGSGPATRARIDALRSTLPFPLRHFWQPDEGYRKCRAMNRGIGMANSDYLVFSDGDCVPRADFLASHLALRRPGWFLSGGYSKLPMALSHRIDRDDILSGRAIDYRWLAAHGLQRHTLKLRAHHPVVKATLNRLTPVAPRFHGHNASAWKADIVRVNGWDERMQYGGQDLELGERLNNAGIRGRTIRYSAVCVHLEHPRDHKKPGMRENCLAIRAETRRTRASWSAHGLLQEALPVRAPSIRAMPRPHGWIESPPG
ncbi:MAG TPA: glycosyltransferase family 2 protein [Dokdonella sp.]|uniref:glycosyltransferase family 2 protein n=1 Tax=Dokdonella sp. TaxID=2291710 RepID=UPI002D0BA60E|nr:glycosyltransferase family 2 protein [Dokdonella sp.]HOX70806.1 glycosyltransferase family 2 protein [Dokdonella sp.]